MANRSFASADSARFVALDVLRGLTLAAMLVVNNPGSWSNVYAPLLHADFNGLTPTDLVFPFFMFIMGYSMFLSLRKFDERNRAAAARKIVGRTLKIFLLGLFINALSMMVFRGFHPETLRILGVLQRLALSYGIAALLTLYVKDTWKLLAGIAVVLAGYGYVLATQNGYVLDETNIVAVIDRAVLGEGHMYKGEGFPFDPEGLLSTLPCVCHVLLGYVVAKRTYSLPRWNRVASLLVIGIMLAALGVACDRYGVYLNKKIWSPSFVLFTVGSGTALLGVCDVLMACGKWMEEFFEPFKVLGMNCIAVFFISDLLAIGLAATGWGGIVYGLMDGLLDPKLASLVFALLFLGVNLGIAWLLYWRRIFIKL